MIEVDGLLAHFRRQRGWTRELVHAVPEERFDWAPAAGAFSCGGLVRHLIQSEVFWRRLLLAAARGETYDPFRELPLSGARTPTERLIAFRPANFAGSGDDRFGSTFADCLASWAEIQAATEGRLAELTPQQLELPVTHPLTGLTAPLWELFLVMIEHEAHHRGQLSAYLKVLGVEQPPVLGTS